MLVYTPGVSLLPKGRVHDNSPCEERGCRVKKSITAGTERTRLLTQAKGVPIDWDAVVVVGAGKSEFRSLKSTMVCWNRHLEKPNALG